MTDKPTPILKSIVHVVKTFEAQGYIRHTFCGRTIDVMKPDMPGKHSAWKLDDKLLCGWERWCKVCSNHPLCLARDTEL